MSGSKTGKINKSGERSNKMGKKVTVIGAGNVGAVVAYTLVTQYEDITELLLIDINEKKAMTKKNTEKNTSIIRSQISFLPRASRNSKRDEMSNTIEITLTPMLRGILNMHSSSVLVGVNTNKNLSRFGLVMSADIY